MQAADLIARIAPSLKQCGEENALKNMGKVLYEYLGEEYPDVLGSILGALKSIVNVMGMEEMEPPIRDLLPRLTPILRNRHEKVQENCIDLVGRIADRGSEFVPAKEWSRICFDLLDMLNAKKKSIRRTTVNTFGYIAKALGPAGRDVHAAEQPEGAGAPEPTLHLHRHRHRGGGVRAVHGAALADERVPPARDECTERAC